MNDTPGCTTGRCNYIYVQCPEHRFLHLFFTEHINGNRNEKKGLQLPAKYECCLGSQLHSTTEGEAEEEEEGNNHAVVPHQHHRHPSSCAT